MSEAEEKFEATKAASQEIIAKSNELLERYREGKHMYDDLLKQLGVTPEQVRRFLDNLSPEDRAKVDAERSQALAELEQKQRDIKESAAPARAPRRRNRNMA